MPWQCSACSSEITADDLVCPGCKSPRTSGTMVPDTTRVLVLSSKKVVV